ncbi:MAG: hypothetical protein U5R48_13840 [Gammaproteobacteria bacterium]|nr:hypothetical protein [Gammaproteobacteria bacterium]
MSSDPCDHDLIRALFDREHLDDHPESIFAIDPDGYLIHVNTAWYRFAMENGGQPGIADHWSLGANYLDAIPPPSWTASTATSCAGCRPMATTGLHSSTASRCSSATMYREYSMLIYALPDEAGHLIVNSRSGGKPP